MEKGLVNIINKRSKSAFASKILKLLPQDFWQKLISFYLDGVGLTHKINPMNEARAAGCQAS